MLIAMQSSTSFLTHYHQEQLWAADDEHFVSVHESFLHELSIMDDLMDHLDDAARARHTAFFSQCQKRYLAIKEKTANQNMLALARSAATSIASKMLDGFDRNAYERVRDLKSLVDFRNCYNVVMVGSGAFPATLLWLQHHFPTLRYSGLDIDPGCVEMANNLVAAMGIDNMRFSLVDGSHCNFDGVDFVYVANHVVPKRAVLQQISRSPSVQQVVVREPTRRGELMAEAARYDLPPAFVITAAGAESGSFMSYDLCLRRA
jgi:hypothetical protein